MDQGDAILVRSEAALGGIDRNFFEVTEGEIEILGGDREFLGHLGVAHEAVIGIEEHSESGF